MTIISIQQLVAHRGLQCEYPENTALSVSKAIAAGALFIEIDIQLSRDKTADGLSRCHSGSRKWSSRADF